MRILITGGNGSVGRDLAPALLMRGHAVVVLDREVGGLDLHPRLQVIRGAVEDAAAVAEAARGAEAIIHLAWSFSEEPAFLLEHDLRGHLHLLDAARREGVRRFLYTSTAVVYGKPVRAPMDEDHPLLVLAARKPAYGMAKEFAEKLTLFAAASGGPPAAVFRFWWAFGREIGGRHLREMLRAAAASQTLAVPADCGGSFLSLEDFIQAVDLLLGADLSGGRVFNLAMRLITGLPFRDTQCGFKLFEARAAREIFSRQRLDGFGFDVEVLYIARRLGYRAVEVPVRWNDVEGTKVSLWRGMTAFLDPLKVRWNSVTGKYR